jgi:hypothetical protein
MTPQNTIAIVYDYDQTLSPSYMQEDVIFPAFGINADSFWRRCDELVRKHGYDNELAYMKVMLDTFGMDRPTNSELGKLGGKLNFYKGLPEMFEEFRKNGGQSIAVYNPDDPQRVSFRKCYQLSAYAGRVKHIAPADYRPNTHLRLLLEQMVEETANRLIAQRREAIETGTVPAPKH